MLADALPHQPSAADLQQRSRDEKADRFQHHRCQHGMGELRTRSPSSRRRYPSLTGGFDRGRRSLTCCAAVRDRFGPMQSTMQNFPLTVAAILRYAATVHGDRTVTTATGDGGYRHATYREVGQQAARLANALRRLGVEGD